MEAHITRVFDDSRCQKSELKNVSFNIRDLKTRTDDIGFASYVKLISTICQSTISMINYMEALPQVYVCTLIKLAISVKMLPKFWFKRTQDAAKQNQQVHKDIVVQSSSSNHPSIGPHCETTAENASTSCGSKNDGIRCMDVQERKVWINPMQMAHEVFSKKTKVDHGHGSVEVRFHTMRNRGGWS